MRRLFLTIGVLCFAAPACAEWVHTTEDDPFTDSPVQLSAAIDTSGYFGGFRCTTAADLALVFVTVEEVGNDGAADLLAALPVKVLVIVDDAPKVELDAKVEPTPDGKKYRVIAQGDDKLTGLLKATLAAKKRFAISQEILGKRYHTHSFNARGSSKALEKLVAACGIKFD